MSFVGCCLVFVACCFDVFSLIVPVVVYCLLFVLCFFVCCLMTVDCCLFDAFVVC